MLSEQGKKVDMVINLTTPKDELVERIISRRICSNPDCKTIYNLILNPPKKEGICDKCGHELYQIADDNKETVETRFDNYIINTQPLVEYYEQKGNLRTEMVSTSINRLGKDVAEDIVKYFNEK